MQEVIGGVWLKQPITSASASTEFTKAKLVSTATHTHAAVHTCNTLFSPQWIFIKAWSGWLLISCVTFNSPVMPMKIPEWVFVDFIFRANYLQTHLYLCQAAVQQLWHYNKWINTFISGVSENANKNIMVMSIMAY